MTRAGNGWAIECLEVGEDKLMVTVGAWDLRHVIENKIMNLISQQAGG